MLTALGQKQRFWFPVHLYAKLGDWFGKQAKVHKKRAAEYVAEKKAGQAELEDADQATKRKMLLIFGKTLRDEMLTAEEEAFAKKYKMFAEYFRKREGKGIEGEMDVFRRKSGKLEAIKDALFASTKNSDKVVNSLSELIQEDPKFALPLIFRGATLCMDVARYKDATKDLDAALENSPTDDLAHFFRGICRLHLKDRQGAALDFRAAMEANPKLSGQCQEYLYLLKE
jgi:tetratricopeptide (TPR) repeat protein